MGEVADHHGAVGSAPGGATLVGEDAVIFLRCCVALVYSVQYAATCCVVRADVDCGGSVVEAHKDGIAGVREEPAVHSREVSRVRKACPHGWIGCRGRGRGDRGGWRMVVGGWWGPAR